MNRKLALSKTAVLSQRLDGTPDTILSLARKLFKELFRVCHPFGGPAQVLEYW
jgi:hypothetical protein